MLERFFYFLNVEITATGLILTSQLPLWKRVKGAGIVHHLPHQIDPNFVILQEHWGIAFEAFGKKLRFLKVTIPDRWARYFVFSPPSSAKRIADLHASACMRFEALFSESSDEWTLVGDWSNPSNIVVCAVPNKLIKDIHDLANQNKQYVVSLEPNFIQKWNQCKDYISDKSWFAISSAEGLAVVVIHNRVIQNVAFLPQPGSQDLVWLCKQLRKISTLYQFSLPHQLQIAGHIPDHWNLVSINAKTTIPIYALTLTEQ